MRRTIAAQMITLLLLLSACADGGAENTFETLRQTAQTSEISATATVAVLGTDTAETFTYDYIETENGCEMSVTEPELLSGVKAQINAGETTLEYDGVILPAPLNENRRAPLTAMEQVLSALRDGHLDLIWQEGETIVVQLIPEDNEAIRLYLGPDGTPTAAELIFDEAAALRCEIHSWNTKRGTDDESNDPNLG